MSFISTTGASNKLYNRILICPNYAGKQKYSGVEVSIMFNATVAYFSEFAIGMNIESAIAIRGSTQSIEKLMKGS